MSSLEPSWDLHETFLEVMRGGSLSAASRALGVAQPTVRRRVEALEEALGVVLFTRAQNGLTPTDAARSILPHAEAMASTAHALTRVASAPTDAVRGTVRLAASEVIGVEVLPPMLASLRVAHPALQIELTLSNRNEDLLRRDADVAVRMTAPTQASLVARKAAVIALGLFASEGYFRTHGEPTTLAELTEHSLIGPDRSRAFLDGLAAAGLPTRRAAYALRTDHDVAHVAAVRAGFGIGICQVPLAAGLRRVLPDFELSLEAWLVTHEDLRAVPRIRAVLDHLGEALADYAD